MWQVFGKSGHLDAVADDVSIVGTGDGRFRALERGGYNLDRIEILGDGTGGDFEASMRVLRAERQLPRLDVPRDR